MDLFPWVEIHKYMGLIYQHPFRRHKFDRFVGFMNRPRLRGMIYRIFWGWAPFPREKTLEEKTGWFTYESNHHPCRKERKSWSEHIWTSREINMPPLSLKASRVYGKNMEPMPLNRLRDVGRTTRMKAPGIPTDQPSCIATENNEVSGKTINRMDGCYGRSFPSSWRDGYS